MKLDVIFRSCSRVFAVHGNRRPTNSSKTELILRCLNSLKRSMDRAVNPEHPNLTLTVVDDHSDSESVEAIQRLLKNSLYPTKFIAMSETGNGNSLLRCYELAKENTNDLIYFVEDDYLHSPNAISEMLEAYRNLKFSVQKDCVIYPHDAPSYYKKYYPSAILLGEKRYWRNVGETTGTLFVSKKVLLDHWDKFMAFTQYGVNPQVSEHNTINQIYKEVPCFSPMPTLAVHMCESGMSPFVNWIEWWEDSKVAQLKPEAKPFQTLDL
jgi:glycosyltransferase involved in cell wall biosynthesis